MGKWPGTYQHYRFVVTSGCITLPRQLETVEVAAICQWPVRLRGEFGQYVRDGFGLGGGACATLFQDMGEGYVAFDDVIGLNKVLRVYSDKIEVGSPTILLNFWNNNRLPVRTQYPASSGTWIDGERVVISTTQTNTVNQCMAGGLVSVQKSRTKGHVFLYEYDTVTLAQRLLAIYEPNETLPNYRRYVIPYANSGTNCTSDVVDIIAKRRYIPAVTDDDELLIGNLSALDLGCLALKLEKSFSTAAFTYWDAARQVLDDELNQFLGDGTQNPIQIVDEVVNASIEALN
jgi:hypothetical protein